MGTSELRVPDPSQVKSDNYNSAYNFLVDMVSYLRSVHSITPAQVAMLSEIWGHWALEGAIRRESGAKQKDFYRVTDRLQDLLDVPLRNKIFGEVGQAVAIPTRVTRAVVPSVMAKTAVPWLQETGPFGNISASFGDVTIAIPAQLATQLPGKQEDGQRLGGDVGRGFLAQVLGWNVDGKSPSDYGQDGATVLASIGSNYRSLGLTQKQFEDIQAALRRGDFMAAFNVAPNSQFSQQMVRSLNTALERVDLERAEVILTFRATGEFPLTENLNMVVRGSEATAFMRATKPVIEILKSEDGKTIVGYKVNTVSSGDLQPVIGGELSADLLIGVRRGQLVIRVGVERPAVSSLPAASAGNYFYGEIGYVNQEGFHPLGGKIAIYPATYLKATADGQVRIKGDLVIGFASINKVPFFFVGSASYIANQGQYDVRLPLEIRAGTIVQPSTRAGTRFDVGAHVVVALPGVEIGGSRPGLLTPGTMVGGGLDFVWLGDLVQAGVAAEAVWGALNTNTPAGNKEAFPQINLLFTLKYDEIGRQSRARNRGGEHGR